MVYPFSPVESLVNSAVLISAWVWVTLSGNTKSIHKGTNIWVNFHTLRNISWMCIVCQAVSGDWEAIKMDRALLSHSVVGRIQRWPQCNDPSPYVIPSSCVWMGLWLWWDITPMVGVLISWLWGNQNEDYSEWAWPSKKNPFKALPTRRDSKREKVCGGVHRPRTWGWHLGAESGDETTDSKYMGTSVTWLQGNAFSQKPEEAWMQMHRAAASPLALWAENEDSWPVEIVR